MIEQTQSVPLTTIHLPRVIAGGFKMSDIFNMTPKERVFGTLRKLIIDLSSSKDLNKDRHIYVKSLKNALSWESEIDNKR